VARDITDSDGFYDIRTDIGIVSSGALWSNTDIAYNTAVGGLPFIYAINDTRPYLRQTAPFRKEQFDASAEPGEQSLTGWWLRSQVSFHGGDGITFYDAQHPGTSQEHEYRRFQDSENVNVWEQGQVTLLRKTDVGTTGYVAAGLQANGRSNLKLSSIEWTVSGTNYMGTLATGDYNIVRVPESGAAQPLVAIANSAHPTADKFWAVANDGEFVYYLVNATSGSVKLHMFKKSLDAGLATASTPMFNTSPVITNATMSYVKERLVAGINNSIYEIPSSATSLPTPIYTHPNTSHIWTAVSASGPAIYVSGWNGLLSSIVKFTLNSSGVMPTLTSAITAAEMPEGEKVYAMKYYLGYLIIGTNYGIRAAVISDQDGSINYGPLIVETEQPVFDFATRDKYVWCASGTTNSKQGLIRIDLGAEIETLRFAYANDIQYDAAIDGSQTVAVAHLGDTDRVTFLTCSGALNNTLSITYRQLTSNVATVTTSIAHGYAVGTVVYVSGLGSPFDSAAGFPFGSHKTITAVPSTTTFSYAATGADVALTASTGTVFIAGAGYAENATELAASGYITTGNIRYGTLEPKNFKRLLGRGDFTYGSLKLESVTSTGTIYDHITYESGVTNVEIGTTQPETPQEYLAYRFTFERSATDTTKGPIFKGYQAKATIATPRQRIIQFPVYCFDVETDRYNSLTGYEGRADVRLRALEAIEEGGDVVMWQDLDTGESRQCVIEQITYSRMTPPDKRFDGQGGVIEIRIRTV